MSHTGTTKPKSTAKKHGTANPPQRAHQVWGKKGQPLSSSTPPFGFGDGDNSHDDQDKDPDSTSAHPPAQGSGAAQPDNNPGASSGADSGIGMPGMSFGMGPGMNPGMSMGFDASNPGQMPDLGALFTQLGRVFSWSGGAVNWDLSTEMARQAPAVMGDSLPTSTDQQQVEDALRLAELWLDPVTTLPAGAHRSAAWNRAQWVDNTLEQWKPYVEPIATRVSAALAQVMAQQAPAELADPQMASMLGPLEQMMSTMGAAMFGSQLGQALGGLAEDVFATTDIGLPLGPRGTAALLPTNVAAFAEQTSLPVDQVRLYLALREAAAHRLFAHAGWLAGRLSTDITRYAGEISIDTARLEDLASQLDPAMLSDPSMLQDPSAAAIVLDDLFSPANTAEQQRVLERLESVLALVEGWIDTVVAQAASEHLPAHAALQESMRRRRATGGPAEQTFANLVGLELRPRRLRDAAALWQATEQARGTQGRDAVWDHPDYLPETEDLDEPLAFASRSSASTDSGLDLQDWEQQLRRNDPPGQRADGDGNNGGADADRHNEDGDKGRDEGGNEGGEK